MIHVVVATLSRCMGADFTERQCISVISGASTEAESRRALLRNEDVIRLIVDGWALDWISVNPITAEALLNDKDVLCQVAIALSDEPSEVRESIKALREKEAERGKR
jgi:hypothetical protein